MNTTPIHKTKEEMATDRMVEYIKGDGLGWGMIAALLAATCFNWRWMLLPGFIAGEIAGWYFQEGRMSAKTMGFWALALVALAFSFRIENEPTYEGTISEMKRFSSGIVIDLDGEYPNQKMMVFIPKDAESNFTQDNFPSLGEKISVHGDKTTYRGQPEVIVKTPKDILGEMPNES